MRILVTIFFLVAFKFTYSQTYNFRFFEDENVKSSFIYDISQDRKGNLWVAHSEGIFIYDGLSFKSINTDDGLIENFIEHVKVDSIDRLWFSYYNGGYGYIENNKVINIDSTLYISNINVNEHGVVYLSSESKVITYSNNEKDLIDISSSKIEFLRNKELLSLDTEGDLFLINSRNQSIKIIDNVSFFSSSIDQNVVFCIRLNKLLTFKILDNGTSKKLNEIDFNESKIEVSNLNLYNNLLEISSLNKGVWEYSFNSDFSSYSKKKLDINHGLQSNNIKSTFLDNENNLWFGSYGNGLYMLPKSRISIFTPYFKRENINCIEGFDNALYLATNQGVVVKNHDSSYVLLQDKRIKTLKKRTNEIWIGTEQNGLYHLKNGVLKKFYFTINTQPKSINCIQFEDESIVVGTNSGLYLYNFITQQTKHIQTNDGLAHNVIENFIIDNTRTFWFNSPDSPLYSYHDGEFIYYKNIQGFNSFNITDIIQLDNNEVWFSTAGDGVFKYANKEFTNYTKKDGLFTNYVYFICEIAHNKILLGHKKGISVLEIVENSPNIRHLGIIKELEYVMPNSYYQAGNKNIWIGTSTNLVNIPLDFINTPNDEPNLFIESLQIGSDTINVKDTINLDYGNYYMELEFKSILLSSPQSISYEWIMEGFDKTWNKGSYDDNKARYQSLKDGNYTFKLKLLVNGKNTKQIKSIYLFIDKPYWEKSWFYILILIFVILGIIFSFYIYNKRNVKLRKMLVKKVDERTQDLNGKNIELKILSQKYLKEKNTVEYQSKELYKSISYATRIQKGMLRKPEYIEWVEEVKGLFLIFKPKDNVSGDFYWAHKKENCFYIAIGDCTGHGVPGAMISMLGTSILSQILTYRDEPNLILNDLRSKIIQQLGSTVSKADKLRDGMDMAFLKFDTKTRKAQSASAHNPVYILRDKSIPLDENLKIIAENENFILLSTYADKQPVGAFEYMNDFSLNEFQLYPKDQIYMFSDGYYDQYGGPKNKKFLKKRFNKLLLDSYGMSSVKQKELLKSTIENWMGNYEQIDDITVLGITIK